MNVYALDSFGVDVAANVWTLVNDEDELAGGVCEVGKGGAV